MVKLSVYLTVEGQEQLALGNSIYSWNYVTRLADSEGPDGAALLGSLEVALPTVEQCLPPVLAKLKKREAEIQAEAYKEVMEIQERRNNLLSLTYAEAKEAE